ncbi:hypothetical protein ACFYOK_36590 [Microbispora bryophytorum]|uniref:hypothetical protein n=1 Tax=Microbispora bryophytorum TaxID=1460882 RepID=UPI0033E60011
MKNLPDAALNALVERTADLIEEPWDAQALSPGRRDYRHTTFGDLLRWLRRWSHAEHG